MRSAARFALHHSIAVGCLGAALFGILVAPAPRAATHPGRWAPPTNPPGPDISAVHLALLPGGGPYHSRIVLWNEHDNHEGIELGWNPGTGDCVAWPYTDLDTLSTWNLPANIFCAGHAQLPSGQGLMTAGGDDKFGVWGIADALTFTPGSGTVPGVWSTRSDMRMARFYPTVTPLRDGRMFVTGGIRYTQTSYFGGRVSGVPPASGPGDSLFRFGRGTKSIWDPPIEIHEDQTGDRPSPREGHTAVEFRRSGVDIHQAYFGGKDAAGVTADQDVHLLRRENGGALDADYRYVWSRQQVAGDPLPARSDHVAVLRDTTPSEMLVYGGLSKPTSGSPTTVLDDFWKLAKNAQNQWVWSSLPTSGSPGPRYGHAAVRYGTALYLFGGSDTAGAEPADTTLYKFTLPNGPWEAVSVTPAPAPRRDHTMVLAGSSLLVYGGYINADSSSAALWKLDLGNLGAGWSVVSADGPSPGARANHTAFFDVGARLTVFGGDPPTGSDAPVDSFLYYLDPFPVSGNPTWVKGPVAPYRLSGHTVVADPHGDMHARIPEIYNPSSNSWTSQTAAGWLPPSDLIGEYPVQFLVPGACGGGRVLRVAPDSATRYLDVPASGIAGSWQTVASLGTFKPVTGVQYAPGKVMVLGGHADFTDDRARTFNAGAIGTAQWVDRPNMASRSDPDIMVLPNGTVLAVGNNCPQIWNPADSSWTGCLASGFTGSYHSTAMLLPDGRVLASQTGSPNFEVFCPPYLFDAEGDTLARPTITSAADSVANGESFVIGKPAADAIGSVCLIRPGAVTHSFDQNGRYVPLTFTTQSGDTTLIATVPDASFAPPGDYMLFILNTDGVPAVARWIRVYDLLDNVPPPAVSDLYADIVTPNEVWLVWYAPGDTPSPLMGAYDLRRSTTGIASDAAYDTATTLTGEPAVQPQGTPVNYTAAGLVECTQYHFALKTRDGVAPCLKNWSQLSNTVTITTTCDGGLSGGSRAERGEGRQAGGLSAVGSSSEAATASLSSLDSGAGAIEVETRRTREGGWQVTLRRVEAAEGVEAADTDAIVSQVRVADGRWRTLGQFRPAAPGPLGLSALRDQGRAVFPTGYVVESVATGLKSRGEESALASAVHSRAAALGESFVDDGGPVELALGEELTLTYEAAGTGPGNEAGVHLVLRPAGLGASSASPAGRRLSSHLPASYALHPNQPNPFGQSTTIGFDLPVAGPVRLEVFDLLGRRVATLAEGDYPAGRHAVQWNLRDGKGPVRPGVYWYRLQSREFGARRKLSVVH